MVESKSDGYKPVKLYNFFQVKIFPEIKLLSL